MMGRHIMALELKVAVAVFVEWSIPYPVSVLVNAYLRAKAPPVVANNSTHLYAPSLHLLHIEDIDRW